METCYMCDEIATSKEHVPPKCMFPESKDVNGENYRNNLITVPSCDKHNSKKSKDDEFLMVSTAGIIGNNSIGYRHKLGKVNRAIRRSSSRLLEKVFLQRKHFFIKTENNLFIEVVWGTPDYERLLSCYKHICYGLHYHHFKSRFVGNIKIIPGYFYKKDKNAKTFNTFMRHKTAIELAKKEKFGANSEIFYYQFTDKDQFGLYLLKICFYDGIDVYASFIPEGIETPANLGMNLIQAGVHTIIDLDGKSYVFNEKNTKQSMA